MTGVQTCALPILVSVITQIRVDIEDVAFARPSKPIGAFMDKQTADERAVNMDWTVGEDSGRGWRRLVPSPRPGEVIELDSIRTLVQAGCGVGAGGGIGRASCRGGG